MAASTPSLSNIHGRTPLRAAPSGVEVSFSPAPQEVEAISSFPSAAVPLAQHKEVGPYLDARTLTGFSQYKYHAIDTSPLSIYVMKPYLNFLVQRMPMWIAPNLLTMVGWLAILSTSVITWYYDPDFSLREREEQAGDIIVPRWVWFYCAFAQFLGHTLDGLDGMQARRTGSSTPLGELFDHGLDSFGTFVQMLAAATAVGVSPGSDVPITALMLVQWSIQLSFYSTHYEKYNTSILYLPWSYDVSQLGVAAIFLVTGLNSVSYWHVPTLLFGYRVTPLLLFRNTVHTAAIVSMVMSFYRIYEHRHSGGFCKYSFVQGLAPLSTLAFTFGVFYLWKETSDDFVQHPRVAAVLMGVVFSNITCRLIVSQMSGFRFNLINRLIVLLPFCWLASMSNLFDQTKLFYVLTAFFTLAHVHYGISVVNELCIYLKIKCFTIPYNKNIKRVPLSTDH
eukprot:m.43746 g.43746  ORF g.43746 m.43746 type:complete len:450 (-) comp12255_c0_seq1:270-1619(-)